MKLLTEEVKDIQVIVESVCDKKNYFIEGIFMQAEQENRNNRVYPYRILERAVQHYNAEYVTKNRALGELGHPDTPSINLDRVSHMIICLSPSGNNFIGKAKILDTQMGNIVKGLLDGGVSLGVSTRGVGSLKPHNGYQLVQDDFRLATAADIVADPSATEAFVRAIREDTEWIFENGNWKEQHHEMAKKAIKSASKSEVETVALRLFNNYLSKL